MQFDELLFHLIYSLFACFHGLNRVGNGAGWSGTPPPRSPTSPPDPGPDLRYGGNITRPRPLRGPATRSGPRNKSDHSIQPEKNCKTIRRFNKNTCTQSAIQDFSKTTPSMNQMHNHKYLKSSSSVHHQLVACLLPLSAARPACRPTHRLHAARLTAPLAACTPSCSLLHRLMP